MITPVTQRWRDRRASYRPVGEPIATRHYEVALIPDDTTARRFVCAHHYSGSYPAARVRAGLYRREGLVGVAVFSQPANDLSLRPLPGGAETNVELGRFVLVDDVPANGETWFLGRAFELLRRDGFAGVVSFSDPMPRTAADGSVTFRGHVGTIYQAHNGVFLGQSRADTLRLLPDGRTVHNRALAKVRKRERGWRYVVEQLVAYGAPEPKGDLRAWLDDILPMLTRRVKHPGNLKYAWALDRRVRRHLPASKPYPKFTANVAATKECAA